MGIVLADGCRPKVLQGLFSQRIWSGLKKVNRARILQLGSLKKVGQVIKSDIKDRRAAIFVAERNSRLDGAIK